MKRVLLVLGVLLLLLLGFCSCAGEAETEGETAEDVAVNTQGEDWTVNTQEDDSKEVNFPNEEIGTVMTEKANILRIKNGAKAVISLTHDDGNLATVQFMNERFLRNGLSGTVGLMGKNFASLEGRIYVSTVAQWAPFFESGVFEVANHSWSHTFVGITDDGDTGVVLYSNTNKNQITDENATIPAGNLTKEIIKSREALISCFPNEKVLIYIKAGTPGYKDENGTFIQLSPDALEMVSDNHIAMRLTTGGLSRAALVENFPFEDAYSLHSLQVSPKHTAEEWKSYVDMAIEKGGWMTYLFHNIVEDDKATGISVGKTNAAALFDYVGEKVASGEVWCAKYSEAVRYSEEYKSAKGVVNTYGDRIEVTLTDELPDMWYDYPLTVLLKIPMDWETAQIIYGDGTVETLSTFVDGEDRMVYANIVPDSGTAVITK